MTTSENPESNGDLFSQQHAPEPPAGEMRFHPDEISSGAGPATDAADDIGARLKFAREARGMALQACGKSLYLPADVLARLEQGDLGKAEDRVFTRGALLSYARLLGIPTFAVDAALRTAAPAQEPPLVATGNALRGNWLQRYGLAATYIVLTATVAVPLVWLGLRGGLDNQLAQIAPLDGSSRTTQMHAAQNDSSRTREQPLLASMTPFSAMNLDTAPAASIVPPQAQANAVAESASPAGHVLSVTATGDSWMEITDASGKSLQSGLLHAGDVRSYHSASPLTVVVGNADALEVTSDGKPLSLAPYSHANVARFEVFAPGTASD